MRVYKIEIMVLDFDGVGDEIKDIIENTKYPNRCIHPKVKSVEYAEIGEWHDNHPFNDPNTAEVEYRRIFGKFHPSAKRRRSIGNLA